MKQLKSFKNAIIYKFKPDFKFTPELLERFEERAAESFFDGVSMRDGLLRQDCFVPPVNDKFIYTLENKIHYIRVKKVVKQIPSVVVKRAWNKAMKEWLAAHLEYTAVPKKIKAELKRDVIEDLSSNAFKVDSYIDVLFTDDFLIVGAGSGKAADDITSMMRKAFETLPAVTANGEINGYFETTVTKDIHAALCLEEMETDDDHGIRTLGFSVGDSISTSGDGQFSGKEITLDSGVVKAALDGGMVVSRVQLCDDYIEFDLGDDLHMKSIKFSLLNEGCLEDEVDANMMIVHDVITRVINKIAEHLDGWRKPESDEK